MAAPTEVYVDPAIAADSGTGTIGDPYGDLQFALNSVTRDATNGNRFNIKAGTDEVMTAAISLATYGTPAVSAPLIFQGYTSAAGDGGIGGISGGGSVSVYDDETRNFVMFVNLHLHNTGTAPVIRCNDSCTFYNCEVDSSTGIGIDADNNTLVMDCYVHNIGGNGIVSLGSGVILFNFLKNGTNKFTTALIINSTSNVAAYNILSIDGATNGIISGNLNNSIYGNSIYSAGGTGRGIQQSFSAATVIMNNIIEGFSGSGGVGIETPSADRDIRFLGFNAFYNNATNISLASDVFIDLSSGNQVLGASPFTDAANDDFTVTTAVKALAFPVANIAGLAVRSYLDIGALQREEPAGSNTARARYLMGIG